MLIEFKNKRRLPAVDIFRGLAIAIMLLVNSLPNFEQAYPLLLHAPWAGLTLADLAFPGFGFIMGAAGALWFPKPKGTIHGISSISSSGARRC
jgi:predicted acyltransferase